MAPSCAGWSGQRGEEHERGGGGAQQLRRDVGERVGRREVAAEREGDRDRRVDVRPGEVARGVDHGHDDQPEGEADADRAERAVAAGVRDDRAAAREDERERRHALRGRAAPERHALGAPARRRASARARRSRRGSGGRRRGRLAGRVVELPVLVALARVDRAGVAAAHRDHDVGGLDRVAGERLGVLPRDVEPDLVHRRDHARVDRGRPARCRRSGPSRGRPPGGRAAPAAIWLRPALWTHTNRTSGMARGGISIDTHHFNRYM